MATFTHRDEGRICALSVTAKADIEAAELVAFFSYMRDMDLRSAIASCSIGNGAVANVTLVDGRGFTTTITAVYPEVTFMVNCDGTGFTVTEFELLRNICTIINSWIGKYGISSLTAVYE